MKEITYFEVRVMGLFHSFTTRVFQSQSDCDTYKLYNDISGETIHAPLDSLTVAEAYKWACFYLNSSIESVIRADKDTLFFEKSKEQKNFYRWAIENIISKSESIDDIKFTHYACINRCTLSVDENLNVSESKQFVEANDYISKGVSYV